MYRKELLTKTLVAVLTVSMSFQSVMPAFASTVENGTAVEQTSEGFSESEDKEAEAEDEFDETENDSDGAEDVAEDESEDAEDDSDGEEENEDLDDSGEPDDDNETDAGTEGKDELDRDETDGAENDGETDDTDADEMTDEAEDAETNAEKDEESEKEEEEDAEDAVIADDNNLKDAATIIEVVEARTAVVEIREVEEDTKTVTLIFRKSSNKIASEEIEIPESENFVSWEMIEEYIPDGYQAKEQEYSINRWGKVFIDVEPVESDTRQVTIIFQDEEGNEIDTAETPLLKEYTMMPWTMVNENVPEGYELKNIPNLYPVEEDVVYAVVGKVEEPESTTRQVIIIFQDEEGNEIGTAETPLLKEYTMMPWTMVNENVPEGYELKNIPNLYPVEEDVVYAVVGKVEEPESTTRQVTIIFQDEEGNEIGTAETPLLKEYTTMPWTMVNENVPEGYELKNVPNLYPVKDDVVYATVGKIEESEGYRAISVNYVNEFGDIIGRERVKLDKNAETFSTDLLRNIPYGYELADTSDVVLGEGNSVNVLIKPISEESEGYRAISVNYVNEYDDIIGRERVKLDKNAETFSTDLLRNIPYGYELADTSDVVLGEGNSVNVLVRPKKEEPDEKVKEITVIYLDTDGNEVGRGLVIVPSEAENVNTDSLTDVPDDYVLSDTEAVIREDGTVLVIVKKVEEEPEIKAAVLNIEYVSESGDVISKRTLTAEGLEGESHVFAASVFTDMAPEDYMIINEAEDITVVFGMEIHVKIEVRKNTGDSGNESGSDNGNNGSSSSGSSGGSGSSGSGSSSGGSSGGSGSSGSSKILTGGQWKLDDTGWWYPFANGTYAKGGWYQLIWKNVHEWYYFNEAGYLISGWFTDADGSRYYLHPLHDGDFGRMYTGWNQVDGKWEFFNDDANAGRLGAWVEGKEVPAELR